MMWLLVGALLCVLIFTVAVIVVLHYAIFQYENTKLENLTRQIKQKNGADILNKVIAKRAFTTFDLNASIKKSKQFASELLQKTVGAVQKVKEINPQDAAKSVAQATVSGAKTVAGGVEKLFTPIEQSRGESTAHSPQISEKMQSVEPTPTEQKKQEYQNDVEKIVTNRAQDAATINIVTENTVTASSAFTKLEQRILKQLQESGMQNYDVWLQLGQLYVKFDEADKAKEVFALVLKHAPAGSKLKETARNGLIGLGS